MSSGTQGRCPKGSRLNSLILWFVTIAVAIAQTPSAPTLPPEGPIQQDSVSVLYVPSNGKLVPVLSGVTPEEVSEWYNVFASLQRPMPRLLITSVDVLADVGARNRNVNYAIKFRVERTQFKTDGWVSTLLGFPEPNLGFGGRAARLPGRTGPATRPGRPSALFCLYFENQ